MKSGKLHKKRIVTIELAQAESLPALTFDNALDFLLELLNKMNAKAIHYGVSAIEVRAIDELDRTYDPGGVAYLLYVAHEIANKKREIESKKNVTLRFRAELGNEKYSAFHRYFPNFPENLQLALEFSQGKKEEEILQAALVARNLARAKRAKEAVKIAEEAVAAAQRSEVAAQDAACRAETAVQDIENAEIVKEARMEAKNFIAELQAKYKAELDKELQELRDKRAAAALEKAQEEARKAEEEKALREKIITDTRQRLEALEEKNKLAKLAQHPPALPDAVEEKPPADKIEKVKQDLLEQAQAKLNTVKDLVHFERKAAILEEIVNFLKEVNKKSDEHILLTFYAKKKFFLDEKFIERCLKTLKHFQECCIAEKNEVMLFLLENMIIIEQEAPFEKRLAYLQEQITQLANDNELKPLLMMLREKLAKIQHTIPPEDLPAITNVMKTIPIPTPGHPIRVEDVRKYKNALLQAEDTTLGDRPWNKTRIAMLCFGILSVASGLALIGISFAALLLSHGFGAPIAGYGVKLGIGLLIGGGAMLYNSASWQRNSLFSSAYETADKAERVAYASSFKAIPSP